MPFLSFGCEQSLVVVFSFDNEYHPRRETHHLQAIHRRHGRNHITEGNTPFEKDYPGGFFIGH
jgi:hypothetical protein